MERRTLVIVRSEYEQLKSVVEQVSGGPLAAHGELLDQELERAELVDAAPEGVVTMNSTVVYEDERTGERRQVKLCYPHEASIESGRVSVLAPVGSALLGLSVGQSIDWPAPGGMRRVRVLSTVPDTPSQLSA